MKIVLLGKNGQVGWELQRSLAPLGQIVALGRHDLGGDLVLPGLTADRIRSEQPDVVVNAAAYTAVDQAESESELCRRVNATAVSEIAMAAADIGALLVNYSTDYVFNGDGDRPWCEGDEKQPLNVYGQSKLEAEQYLEAAGCKYFNFRTSWVYGVRGANFAKTIISLAQERDALNVVSDQVGAPTGADLIADVTAHAIRTANIEHECFGTYHLVPNGFTSWFGYANYCVEVACAKGANFKLTKNALNPIMAGEYKTAAKRPYNSRLSNAKIETMFKLSMPDWRHGVERFVSNIFNK